MKLKNFEEHSTVNEGIGGDYNIDNQTVKKGSFGVEFDEWITNCNKKAEEKKWNNWEFRRVTKDKDPEQKRIIFMVNERPHDSKNILNKGEFDLTTKKGTLLESVNEGLNPDLGVININITGKGWIKNAGTDRVMQALQGLQGERHIFVDGEEVGVRGSQRPVFGHKAGY